MFPIELCPEVMRNFGLERGRRLMETWFSRVAAVAPRYSAPVTDVITMDWVLRFARAKNVFEKLIADEIWTAEAAQIEIGRVLHRKGLLGRFPGTKAFGDLTRPPAELDDDYINQRPVTRYQGVDDLAAALGAFALRVVVAGSVKAGGVEGTYLDETLMGHYVTINEIGVYVRDSYDFEGDQFLGWWTYPDRYEYWRYDHVDTGRRSHRYPHGHVLSLPFAGGELVTNEDFKKFRRKRLKGGDFLVYSDLKRVPVNFTFGTSALLHKHGSDVFQPTERDMIKLVNKKVGVTLG